jgi:hypothetical protein
VFQPPAPPPKGRPESSTFDGHIFPESQRLSELLRYSGVNETQVTQRLLARIEDGNEISSETGDEPGKKLGNREISTKPLDKI